MRIKWTSIPNVTHTSPATPWAGNAVPERPKQETVNEREPDKKEKKAKKTASR